jgi:PPOX class probable F420-dependent enzyme
MVDEAEARRRFRGERVARLATVTPEGRPHLVPVVFALEGDRVWTIVDRKPKRTTDLRRLANVRAEPRVSLLVDGYDDQDWAALWWVRADGTGAVLEGSDDVARAVSILAAKYPLHAEDPPRGPVLAIDVERWVGWAARP